MLILRSFVRNLALMGKLGIEILCYNFMPLYSWFRTDYTMPLFDGSNAMSFDQNDIDKVVDPWATDFASVIGP